MYFPDYKDGYSHRGKTIEPDGASKKLQTYVFYKIEDYEKRAHQINRIVKCIENFLHHEIHCFYSIDTLIKRIQELSATWWVQKDEVEACKFLCSNPSYVLHGKIQTEAVKQGILSLQSEAERSSGLAHGYRMVYCNSEFQKDSSAFMDAWPYPREGVYEQLWQTMRDVEESGRYPSQREFFIDLSCADPSIVRRIETASFWQDPSGLE